MAARAKSEDHRRRARVYPLLGALLGLGAPAGLLLLRALLGPIQSGLASWLWGELSGDATLYVYLTVSTVTVLGVCGRVLGRQQDLLLARALTDPLTGLANRRRFDERLGYEVARAERYDTPLAVLMIDIDGLKRINDEYGHTIGDGAIQTVAEALTRCLRRSDLAARLGGDEFAVITPSTDATGALELAQRVRVTLAELVSTAGAALSELAVSIGIADLRGAESFEAMAVLAVADHALYRAKSAGGDAPVVGSRRAALGGSGSLKGFFLGVTTLLAAAAGCKAPQPHVGPEDAVLAKEGNVEAGRKAVEDLRCYTCHRIADEGFPDPVADPVVPVVLGKAAGGRIPSDTELLLAILEPSHELPPESMLIDTWPWLLDENGKSRMGDFSQAMTVRQMVDILAYLRSRYNESSRDESAPAEAP